MDGSPSRDLLLAGELRFRQRNDDDEWDDAEDESEIGDTPVCWQLDITYRNGVSQQVVSYDSLPDRAEELVWKLMGYLFPMEDEEENPME